MATWDATYETLPPGTTETGSSGDDRIRSWKAETADRFDQEHVWMSTGSTGQTVHRKGSARAYYSATAPTLRPDAATALGASDDGRLFVDSDVNEGYVWNGSSMATIGGNSLLDQGGGSHIKRTLLTFSGINISTQYNSATTLPMAVSTIVAATGLAVNNAKTEYHVVNGPSTERAAMRFSGTAYPLDYPFELEVAAGSVFNSADFYSADLYILVEHAEA